MEKHQKGSWLVSQLLIYDCYELAHFTRLNVIADTSISGRMSEVFVYCHATNFFRIKEAFPELKDVLIFYRDVCVDLQNAMSKVHVGDVVVKYKRDKRCFFLSACLSIYIAEVTAKYQGEKIVSEFNKAREENKSNLEQSTELN